MPVNFYYKELGKLKFKTWSNDCIILLGQNCLCCVVTKTGDFVTYFDNKADIKKCIKYGSIVSDLEYIKLNTKYNRYKEFLPLTDNGVKTKLYRKEKDNVKFIDR